MFHWLRVILMVLSVLTFLTCLLLVAAGEQEKSAMKPFLCLPLRSDTKVEITEGWIYSEEEESIHGYKIHYGIDFAAKRGTPVLAAADGVAIASYHVNYLDKPLAKRPVGFALGRVVEIWHPEQKCYTCYAHLDSLADDIPYIEPVLRGKVWYPNVLNQSPDEKLKLGKHVKRGQVMGSVGDSGLAWEADEKPSRSSHDPPFMSWDETHLHFEIYTRHGGGSKKDRWDPYDLYKPREAYQENPLRGLWLPSKKGDQPKWANEK